MEKRYALLFAFLITSLVAGNYFFFTSDSAERESVKIVRVLDGDTVEIDDGRKVRFANINTPEKKFAYSELSKDYLDKFIGKDIKMENLGGDKYGRTLGKLFFEKEYLNLEIVKRGMAHSYLVFEDEEREFSRAEKYALDEGLGIWRTSKNANCISAIINKYEEYVIINDLCNLNEVGWTIKDESTKSYRIEEDFDEKLTIYSGEGVDSKDVRYWKRKNVWNDEGDRIFIRDADGLLVFYNAY